MSLPPLPPQPAGLAWPTAGWPEGEVPEACAAEIGRRLDYAFGPGSHADLGETHALVIVQGGRLVAERYAEGFGPDQTYPSWSMAKSITQALAGMLVGDGRLDIHAPADVPEWRAPGDPRGAITLDLLLRMSSGLTFVEDYEPDHPSDVIAMLFGEGKNDVAHFAARQPLAHPPGSFWSYSSGTTNIVSRALSRATDAYGAEFEAFMRRRLFEPLGMTSAKPKFDAAGTFIGSSYCFCSARDFARFGLLYLRGGVWEGRQLLPAAWVDYARTPTWQQPNDEGPYGAHWWLGMAGPDSFSANGYQGQYIAVAPDLDMVIVRHGKTPLDRKPAAKAFVGALADVFRQV
jgi:CubicO group peptidase (beta-lactamase class C family)